MSKQVEAFYDQDPNYEWQRLDRHRTEYAVSLRAMRDYLPPAPAAVLDIGGGPGRYTIALAQQGYAVTLFDLSSILLAFAQERATERGVTLRDTVHGSATDLTCFADAAFDAVLLMGPLYHLLTESERAQAVREAGRVLQPGGVLFASFIVRYAALRNAAKLDPTWIMTSTDEHARILQTGVHHGGPEAFTAAYFAHPTEIAPFMAAQGFTQRNLIACEGAISMIEEGVNQLEGDLWQAWVELNYTIGQDPCLHGGAEHLLYVGQKA